MKASEALGNLRGFPGTSQHTERRKAKPQPVVASFRPTDDPIIRMNRTREKLDEPITNSRLKRSNYIQRAIKVMDDEAGNQKMKNRVAQKS